LSHLIRRIIVDKIILVKEQTRLDVIMHVTVIELAFLPEGYSDFLCTMIIMFPLQALLLQGRIYNPLQRNEHINIYA